jgi:hypothetical protein
MDNDINKEQQNDEKRLLVQTDYCKLYVFLKLIHFYF